MSEITPKAKELLLALAQELLDAEDVVELTGEGRRRIVSHAGATMYGKHPGTEITPEMDAERHLRTSGVDPNAPAPKKPTAKELKDAQTYVTKVHVHPRDPGSKIYEFSDGTGVVEDPRGNRTERKKLDTKAIVELGWRPHGDGPTAQDDIDAEERTKKAKEKIKQIASSTKRHANHSKAVKNYEDYSEKIDHVMRNGEDHGKHVETISGLRNLLENSKTTERHTLHRGMGFASQQDRDVFVSQVLRPGHSFNDKTFVTASAHPDVAVSHADSGGIDGAGVIVNIDVPKGSRAAALGHVKGQDDDDHEVMLGDNGRYVVKDVHSDDKGRVIAHMNYIDPMSGKSPREKQQDEEAIPERVWERQRNKRFAWDPKHITVEDSEGKPVVMEPQGNSIPSKNVDKGHRR